MHNCHSYLHAKGHKKKKLNTEKLDNQTRAIYILCYRGSNKLTFWFSEPTSKEQQCYRLLGILYQKGCSFRYRDILSILEYFTIHLKCYICKDDNSISYEHNQIFFPFEIPMWLEYVNVTWHFAKVPVHSFKRLLVSITWWSKHKSWQILNETKIYCITHKLTLYNLKMKPWFL